VFVQALKRLFTISAAEAEFSRRGFRCVDPLIQNRLERVGRVFIDGYLAALDAPSSQVISERLNIAEPEFRGFAYEGAAMGLALLDSVTPWRTDRLSKFIDGPASCHVYMAHVGAGWAFARLRFFYRRVESFLPGLDPLLRWLAIDGYGFHEGYFRWREFIEQQHRPARLSADALRVFDQGLGRSLWFVVGGSVADAVRRISAFPADRQADLWSGLGLACTYAGGISEDGLQSLLEAAGQHLGQVRQGAAFAAKARLRAGNLVPHTENACLILCGVPADVAARITDDALEGVSSSAGPRSYALWRRRVIEHFVAGRCVA